MLCNLLDEIRSDAEEAGIIEAPEAEWSLPGVGLDETSSDDFDILDELNIEEIFRNRVLLLKNVPFFIRGSLRSAYRLSLD